MLRNQFHLLQAASHNDLRPLAESVPLSFRFSLKAPKQITHVCKLQDCAELLDEFLRVVAPLTQNSRSVLLFQFPPRLEFVLEVAWRFFGQVRGSYEGPLVCEPRHAGWFEPNVEELWQEFRIARAAADPAVVPQAARPGGWRGLNYFRWHGSPQMYFSAYESGNLERLSEAIRGCSVDTFCIFDNTAGGAAVPNALELRDHLASKTTGRAAQLPPGR